MVRFIVLTAFLCFFGNQLSIAQQDSSIVILIPEAKCVLTLPNQNNFVNDQLGTMMSKAEYVINDYLKDSLDLDSVVKPYFLIRNGNFNMMNCQVSVFDSSAFPSWDSSHSFTTELVVEIIEKQGPKIQLLNSTLGTLTLNGKEFKSQILETYYPDIDISMHTIWLCSNFGAYDLGFNISYTDEAWKEEAIRILSKIQYLE